MYTLYMVREGESPKLFEATTPHEWWFQIGVPGGVKHGPQSPIYAELLGSVRPGRFCIYWTWEGGTFREKCN